MQYAEVEEECDECAPAGDASECPADECEVASCGHDGRCAVRPLLMPLRLCHALAVLCRSRCAVQWLSDRVRCVTHQCASNSPVCAILQYAHAPDGPSDECDDSDNTTIDACASGECVNTQKPCTPGPCEVADGYDSDGECLVRLAWQVLFEHNPVHSLSLCMPVGHV